MDLFIRIYDDFMYFLCELYWLWKSYTDKLWMEFQLCKSSDVTNDSFSTTAVTILLVSL